MWRKPDDRMALFAALTLVAVGALSVAGNVDGGPSLLRAAIQLLNTLELFCFLLFLCLFPDGRFVPRWTAWVMLAVVAWVVLDAILPNPDPLGPVWFVFAGSLVVAQIHRYRRVSGPVQRQQTKWVVFGVAVAVLTIFGAFLATQVLPTAGSQGVPTGLIFAPIATVVLLLVPLSIGISVLRRRLWDIDVVVNRTLAYGALTACVVGIYVLIVGYLGALLKTDGNLLVSLAATGVVAVPFQPLRERLKRGVNRPMYGERDAPYAILAPAATS